MQSERDINHCLHQAGSNWFVVADKNPDGVLYVHVDDDTCIATFERRTPVSALLECERLYKAAYAAGVADGMAKAQTPRDLFDAKR